MTYRELQSACKEIRELTGFPVKLNSKATVLQAYYDEHKDVLMSGDQDIINSDESVTTLHNDSCMDAHLTVDSTALCVYDGGAPLPMVDSEAAVCKLKIPNKAHEINVLDKGHRDNPYEENHKFCLNYVPKDGDCPVQWTLDSTLVCSLEDRPFNPDEYRFYLHCRHDLRFTAAESYDMLKARRSLTPQSTLAEASQAIAADRPYEIEGHLQTRTEFIPLMVWCLLFICLLCVLLYKGISATFLAVALIALLFRGTTEIVWQSYILPFLNRVMLKALLLSR